MVYNFNVQTFVPYYCCLLAITLANGFFSELVYRRGSCNSKTGLIGFLVDFKNHKFLAKNSCKWQHNSFIFTYNLFLIWLIWSILPFFSKLLIIWCWTHKGYPKITKYLLSIEIYPNLCRNIHVLEWPGAKFSLLMTSLTSIWCFNYWAIL